MIVLKHFIRDWGNLLLTIAGASAIFLYLIQERRKVSEAASLIVLQVNDLQEKLREIQSYIVDGKLNDSAFYESQEIFTNNYWDRYKHYFVRKLDPDSFNLFNEFYDCASEVLEQQQLMKNMLKNSFYITQNWFSQLEAAYMQTGLQNCVANPVDMNSLIQGLMQTAPQNLTAEQKGAVENMIRQIGASSANVDFSFFWNTYRRNQSNIQMVINQNGFSVYIPKQIQLSLEKALKKYLSFQILGCEGYNKLRRYANRRI